MKYMARRSSLRSRCTATRYQFHSSMAFEVFVAVSWATAR